MWNCVVVIFALIIAFIPPGYTSVAIAAQPSCDSALGDAYIIDLRSSLKQLAELQRHNVDTIEFNKQDIIRTHQGRFCFLIAPYEMLETDGGNTVERYVGIFEINSEDPLISDLRRAAHLKQKHIVLTGFYPIGTWGRVDWRRASISNNQITVPAESLLCTRYKCCNGGTGIVVIEIQILSGQVVANISNEYNGSDDPSKCPWPPRP